MFQEAFHKLDLDESARLLEDINPLLEGITFDPINVTIMAADLSFYPGFRLLDISDYTVMPPAKRYVVQAPGLMSVLNFSNAPVYALNKDVPVELTDKTVTDYVRFFFTVVHGQHGRFLIVENVDDINWKEDPPPQARKAIAQMIKPLHLIRYDSEHSVFHVGVCMMFKDSLFQSKIEVKETGEIRVFDEELLIEDMPILDDMLEG